MCKLSSGSTARKLERAFMKKFGPVIVKNFPYRFLKGDCHAHREKWDKYEWYITLPSSDRKLFPEMAVTFCMGSNSKEVIESIDEMTEEEFIKHVRSS
jgi:hypothetical protein